MVLATRAGEAGVISKRSRQGSQSGWDRLDPSNIWVLSDQQSWEPSASLFAWLRTDIRRKIKIKKKDLVIRQTNNRLWDFALNILNNPISSLEKWVYFNDRVRVSIYFPCTSVWWRLSTPAEVNPLCGIYPCHQVWGSRRQKPLCCYSSGVEAVSQPLHLLTFFSIPTSCLGVQPSRSSMGGMLYQAESNCGLRRHEYTTWFWLCHFYLPNGNNHHIKVMGHLGNEDCTSGGAWTRASNSPPGCCFCLSGCLRAIVCH